MIRSEVQRTLVKSPPELWSELSDPESLARHLGELGDITITRVEPENLVEWEAEGTTGTVEIEASGWGTRVTLTVSRELSGEAQSADQAEQDSGEAAIEAVAGEPEAGEAATEAVAGDAAEATEPEAGEAAIEAVAGEPGGTVEAEPPAATAEVEPEAPDAGADEAARAPSDAELDATEPAAAEQTALTDAAEQPLAPPKPGPATEAARRAAGWPNASHEPEDWPAETPAPETLPVWSSQEHDLDLDETETPPTPERRPGFFARLFRRRRSGPEAPAVRQLADILAFDTDEADATEALEESAPEPEPFAEIESPLAGEPPLGDEQEERSPAGRQNEEPGAETHEEQPVAEEPEEMLEPEVEAPVAAAAPDDGEAAEAEEAGSTGAPADLSAELLEAEEVAAEHVEAVLTAALDRLGSAHHRPFSRS